LIFTPIPDALRPFDPLRASFAGMREEGQVVTVMEMVVVAYKERGCWSDEYFDTF